jgi:hypothetical protein
MARFSEEEIETLIGLVEIEREDINSGFGRVWAPELVPFLDNLKQKLEDYHNKHYPEDRNDA